MWSAMNTIFFSLQGFFTVSVTAAENKHVDRDETIKLASRKIALRVILLYTLIVFTVGLNVPYNDMDPQARLSAPSVGDKIHLSSSPVCGMELLDGLISSMPFISSLHSRLESMGCIFLVGCCMP